MEGWRQRQPGQRENLVHEKSYKRKTTKEKNLLDRDLPSHGRR
jgi:hypothetical protein